MSATLSSLQELIMWVISNREGLGFTQALQELKAAPGHFTSLVSLRYESQQVQGAFTSSNSAHATGIAIVEALERVAMFAYRLESSNGVAAHFDIEQAKMNARLELLERDAFLRAYHWRLKLAPTTVSPAGTSCFTLPLRTADNLVAVLCVLNGEKPIYGLGIAPTIEAATQKAYFETLPLSQFVEHTKLPALTPSAFAQMERAEVHHHVQLGFSDEFKATLNGWPHQGNDYVELPKLSTDFAYEILPLPKGFQAPGLHVVQARHPELLSYYIGQFGELSRQQSYRSLTKLLGPPEIQLPHSFS